jgi:hypothetical protein
VDRLVQQLLQTPWLIAALVAGNLAIALPSQAGSAPTGLNSGVTLGGSTLLPLGGSSIGEEELIESASPNATVDALTGEVTLTAAAQQQVNQSATSLLQGLASSSPALAALLTTPGEINLSSISLAGASGGGGETEDSLTVSESSAAAAAAIASGGSVSLTSSQGTLTIAAPTPIAGQNPADPSAIRATSAVFIPEGGNPVVVPLQGTQAQIANAAGFLAAAFAAGFTPSQVASFTDMALTGASYIDLVALFNAVGGLLLEAQSGDASENAVNATQLEAAIQAYNSILNSSDAATVAALSQNSDFVTLGRSLQQLRAAVDL